MSSSNTQNQLVSALMTTDRMWETTIDTLPDANGPEAFAELVARETRKWADVVGRSGAKVD